MCTHPKVFSRWVIVVGAVMIQLALGAIYAWSVFTKLLTEPGGDYGFSATQAAWVFSASLAVFAIVMVFAGHWQARFGPRPGALLGGIILGAGYILGGLLGHSFWAQLVFVGILEGAGIGLVYVVPIAVGVKWFPDKKGLVTGLAVAGFGFGATIWVKLASSWFGGLLNTTHVLGLPGVQSVFVIYGLIFLVPVVLGSLVMVNPLEGYAPAGWTPPAPGQSHRLRGHRVLPSGDAAETTVLCPVERIHVLRPGRADGHLQHQALWHRCPDPQWRGAGWRHHRYGHGVVRDLQRSGPDRLGLGIRSHRGPACPGWRRS